MVVFATTFCYNSQMPGENYESEWGRVNYGDWGQEADVSQIDHLCNLSAETLDLHGLKYTETIAKVDLDDRIAVFSSTVGSDGFLESMEFTIHEGEDTSDYDPLNNEEVVVIRVIFDGAGKLASFNLFGDELDSDSLSYDNAAFVKEALDKLKSRGVTLGFVSSVEDILNKHIDFKRNDLAEDQQANLSLSSINEYLYFTRTNQDIVFERQLYQHLLKDGRFLTVLGSKRQNCNDNSQEYCSLAISLKDSRNGITTHFNRAALSLAAVTETIEDTEDRFVDAISPTQDYADADSVASVLSSLYDSNVEEYASNMELELYRNSELSLEQSYQDSIELLKQYFDEGNHEAQAKALTDLLSLSINTFKEKFEKCYGLIPNIADKIEDNNLLNLMLDEGTNRIYVRTPRFWTLVNSELIEATQHNKSSLFPFAYLGAIPRSLDGDSPITDIFIFGIIAGQVTELNEDGHLISEKRREFIYMPYSLIKDNLIPPS